MKRLKLLSVLIGSSILLAATMYASRDEVRTVEYSSSQKNEKIVLTDSYYQAVRSKQILEKISDSKDEFDYAEASKELISIKDEQDPQKIKYLVRKSDNRREANLITIDSVRKVFVLKNRKSGRELSFVEPPSDSEYQITNRKYIITRRKSKIFDRSRYHLEIIDYAETDGLELNDNDMF